MSWQEVPAIEASLALLVAASNLHQTALYHNFFTYLGVAEVSRVNIACRLVWEY